MPTHHCHRCCLADHVSAHGLVIANHCKHCCSQDSLCKVDLSSSHCSEYICMARTCSLAQSEVERCSPLPSRWCLSLTFFQITRLLWSRNVFGPPLERLSKMHQMHFRLLQRPPPMPLGCVSSWTSWRVRIAKSSSPSWST